MRISDRVLESFGGGKRERALNPFLPLHGPAPGVIVGDTALAMDQGNGISAWAYNNLSSFAGLALEGQMFLGYPTLAAMSQRVEYYNAVTTIADDMTRKGIEFKSKADGEDKSAKIAKIEEKMDAVDLMGVFKQGIINDGNFGRGHIYIDTGDSKDHEELKTDIGSGANSAASAWNGQRQGRRRAQGDRAGLDLSGQVRDERPAVAELVQPGELAGAGHGDPSISASHHHLASGQRSPEASLLFRRA
jgi:Anti-CBASS Acb1-like protein